ncbi:hypothetical protein [Methanobrevibacter sp.]|uniref:hypothetical protein n=1 Tax=Methanobrevibacter sp. TaxID=66852 RepID=UPI003869D5CE
MKDIKQDFEDVSPKEIFDFAYELNSIKEDLNSSNSTINRTVYVKIYYAVFLFLREWLKKYTEYKSLRGEHKKLPNFIKIRGPFDNEKNNEIYEDLLLLKKLRHQADYRLTVPSKYSQEYKKWKFTSIESAFNIAKGILHTFMDNKNV